MEHTSNMQLMIFVYSCLLGIGLGLLYDFFRIIRMMINPRHLGVFFQDIIYFIVSGIITFLFVLGFNYGESRFYILAGEGIGWIAYHITFGEVVYISSQRIVKFFKRRTGMIFNSIKGLSKKKHENLEQNRQNKV